MHALWRRGVADGRLHFFLFFFVFFLFLVIPVNAQNLGIELLVVGARGAPSALCILLDLVARSDIMQLYMPAAASGMRQRLAFLSLFSRFFKLLIF